MGWVQGGLGEGPAQKNLAIAPRDTKVGSAGCAPAALIRNTICGHDQSTMGVFETPSTSIDRGRWYGARANMGQGAGPIGASSMHGPIGPRDTTGLPHLVHWVAANLGGCGQAGAWGRGGSWECWRCCGGGASNQNMTGLPASKNTRYGHVVSKSFKRDLLTVGLKYPRNLRSTVF